MLRCIWAGESGLLRVLSVFRIVFFYITITTFTLYFVSLFTISPRMPRCNRLWGWGGSLRVLSVFTIEFLTLQLQLLHCIFWVISLNRLIFFSLNRSWGWGGLLGVCQREYFHPPPVQISVLVRARQSEKESALAVFERQVVCLREYLFHN